jgi:hypothetical protein
MSRKLRVPKQQAGALPSPAWMYALLVGADPGVRLPGWPQMYQQHMGEPDAAAVSAQYADALCALASQHDFEPYWLHDQPPTGPGFRRWCEAFLAEHRY